MSKEHAYAYEAGYRDGSIHYELEHCPACKNIADLQEALEENAKLFTSLKHESEQTEKLRELVRDLWRDREALPYGLYLPIKERMRELGVEGD